MLAVGVPQVPNCSKSIFFRLLNPCTSSLSLHSGFQRACYLRGDGICLTLPAHPRRACSAPVPACALVSGRAARNACGSGLEPKQAGAAAPASADLCVIPDSMNY